MRKLTYLFLFILPFYSCGQNLDFLVPAPVAYDTDFQTYLTAVEATGVNLTPAQETAQNSFVLALKSAGLWTRMKTGYLFFNGSLEAGRINLKNPATYQTTVTSEVFYISASGVRSNGNDSYINQPFTGNEYANIQTDLTTISYINDGSSVPPSALTYGALPAGSLAHGVRTTSAAANYIGLYPRFSKDNDGYRYQSGGSNLFTSSTNRGLYVTTYNGTQTVIYKDGTKSSTNSTPATPTIAANRFILSNNNATTNGGASPSSFFDRVVSVDFLFDRFTDADELAFRNAFTTYILPLIDQTTPTRLLGWSSHCWFARDKAVYHSGSGKSFFGSVHNATQPLANYSQTIFELIHATGELKRFKLGTSNQQDDHNEPAILIRASDSRLVATYAEHGGAVIRWRISTNATDASAWGSESTLDPAGTGIRRYTYPSIFQVVNGDIYIFFRDQSLAGGEESQWAYIKSTNNGVTFSGYTQFSDFTYANAAQDPTNKDKIHFLVSEHPGDGNDPNQIGHFYFDASDGTFRKSDGTNVTANIPLAVANVTVIQSNALPIQCWIGDLIVDATGKPRATYTIIPNETTSLIKTEYYTEWTGTEWTTPHLLHTSATHYMETGGAPITSKWYSPGQCFDRGNPDRIIASKEVNGVCEIHVLTRVSSSSFTTVQKTFNSTYDQWRPFTTAAPDNNVFWMNKIDYRDWINAYYQELIIATY